MLATSRPLIAVKPWSRRFTASSGLVCPDFSPCRIAMAWQDPGAHRENYGREVFQ